MKPIISSTFFLLVLLSLSVFLFDPSNLYFELPWLDIPMHVLGGFGVASLVLAVLAYQKRKSSLVVVMVLYVCVAISWEMYEFINDVLRYISWNGWHDTFSDIANGAVGAIIAFLLLKK